MSNSTFPTIIDVQAGGIPAYDDALDAIENFLGVPTNWGTKATATVVLAPGLNIIKSTSSDTTTLTLPTTLPVGTRIMLLATQAASTAGTWAWTTAPKSAAGGCTLSSTASFVDFAEFVFDGTNWDVISLQVHLS